MAGRRRPNLFGRRRRPNFFGNADRRPPWMLDIDPRIPETPKMLGVKVISTDDEFDYIDKAEDLYRAPGLPCL